MDETIGTVRIPGAPTKIGRYEIVGELGRGAMGIVYKGFDPNIDRTVAIKTIQLNADNKETIERFRREARAAGGLSHPGIVTIYDAGEDQGVFYIAMEFVEGETLQSVIARGPLTVEEATAVMNEIGSALDLAHARQIVHRDIKPANIMIAGGHAKVMDFGVAKMASSTATATGMVIGTPSYMSPEGVKGLPVDGRADIFSLGVVLYEMLTGRRPFQGDSIPSVIYKIVGEQPTLATVVNPELSAGLDVVLTKALAKDPYDRYQSCEALLNDLKNHQTLPPLPASPPASAPRAVSSARAVSAPLAPSTPAAPSAPAAAISPPPAETAATVAMTVAIPPPAAPPDAAKPAASKPERSRTPLLAAAGVLVVVLGGGGLWWSSQHRQAVAPQAGTSPPAAAPPASATPVTPAPTGNSAAPVTPPPETPAPDSKTAKPAATAPAKKRDPAPGAKTVSPPVQTPATPSPSAAAPAHKPQATVPEAPAPGGEGRLRVITQPAGARIFIDDQRTNYSSPVNLPIPAGRHKITITHKGFEDVTREVTIHANQMAELEINFRQP